jgi:hypothetical protein
VFGKHVPQWQIQDRRHDRFADFKQRGLPPGRIGLHRPRHRTDGHPMLIGGRVAGRRPRRQVRAQAGWRVVFCVLSPWVCMTEQCSSGWFGHCGFVAAGNTIAAPSCTTTAPTYDEPAFMDLMCCDDDWGPAKSIRVRPSSPRSSRSPSTGRRSDPTPMWVIAATARWSRATRLVTCLRRALRRALFTACAVH